MIINNSNNYEKNHKNEISQKKNHLKDEKQVKYIKEKKRKIFNDFFFKFSFA